MVRRLRKLSNQILQHRYGVTLGAFLTAAALTGLVCVLFMWAFEFVLAHRLDGQRIGVWCWLSTPVLFLLAVQLIRHVAPSADGAGIPQAIFAAQHLTEETREHLSSLVSAKTMFVKVGALLLGVWAGASTGREGPTVHVAACFFFTAMLLLRRWTKLTLDLRSAVVAGGAAGLAAAFNTPLAGVTFAIEELSTDYFSAMKDFVLMAIVVAGIAAKSLTGEYTYFGRLAIPSPLPIQAVLLIGILGGACGALFSTALIEGKRMTSRFGNGIGQYAVPVVFSWALLLVASMAGADVLGPGNKVAQVLVRGDYQNWVAAFPLWKMAATLLTYWSGIAGGIFAPCLSMGAAVGSQLGHWLQGPIEGCALIGMAAFLSGAIQAPITAFVIIFEMTGYHQMLLPIMLASLLAFMVARLFRAKHLYHALAIYYQDLLPVRTANTASPPGITTH